MDIESQKSRYREYIKRLTVGIDADDRQKLTSAYEKLRAANEQFFRNNAKTVGVDQADKLRAALEDVIHEYDTELSVGHAFADVDFAGDEEIEPPPSPKQDEPASPTQDEPVVTQIDAGERPVPDEADIIPASIPQDEQPAFERSDDPISLAEDQPAVAPLKAVSLQALPPARPRRAAWLLGGAMLGLLAATGLAYALVSTGQVGVLRDKQAIARNAAFESLYAKDVPAIELAGGFLRQVEAEILQRQKTAADALEADFGRRFKELKEFDAELAKKLPAGLPKGTRVMLRAGAKGYKVLLQGRLCQAASFADPKLVDPTRAPDGLGCTNLAVWNPAGAKF